MKKFYSLLVALVACASMSAQTIEIEDVLIKAGSTADITISLKDANKIKAFGAVVEGIESVKPTNASASVLTAVDWTVAGKAKDNNYKMAVVNMVTNTAFVATSGDLVNVTFTADATAVDGTYQAKISSVEFADATTGALIKGEDVVFNIVVCQAQTAIRTISNSASTSAVYNASGVLQNGVKKGVNIIRMNDGKVKKVIK